MPGYGDAVKAHLALGNNYERIYAKKTRKIQHPETA